MIVASGSVSMDIDLNRINGVNSTHPKIGDITFSRHRLLSFRCLCLIKCCAEHRQAPWRWCRKITSRFLQH